jgi:hypothetical protein
MRREPVHLLDDHENRIGKELIHMRLVIPVVLRALARVEKPVPKNNITAPDGCKPI